MIYPFLILFFLFLIVIFYYNRLVRAKNMVQEAWSGIDVQLKRRYNLIPNLTETVQAYAKHEKGLLEEVARIRTQCMQAKEVGEQSRAENALTQSLKSIFALAEAYPELKANQNFMELQKNLVEIEDQIQLARRYYNGSARDYNIQVESFPGLIFAKFFSFKSREYFEIELATQREVPQVKFS
ncbi:MAG: LemA family protein [Deltaproteobacteria bacterium]|nr:LemA family protein [Deltaproteobacteria bacterium]